MMFFILVIFGAVFVYILLKPCSYWTQRGINQGPMVPIFGDYFKAIFRMESFFDMVLRTYRRFPGTRYSGMYHMRFPMLLIKDPELFRRITVKDFDHFTDHRHFLPEGADPFWNKSLFALRGNKWKEMRGTLSPAFTSSKIRGMFHLVDECAQRLSNHYGQKCERNGVQVCEMKDLFLRYTNDVIATCGFGIKLDSIKERDNEFYVMGKKATNFAEFRRVFKILIYMVMPAAAKVLDFSMFSKEANSFFESMVSNNLAFREETNLMRPDLINVLMEARKKNKSITLLDITAQAMFFFAAGLDTASTLMGFMAYELALNPKIQEKLQLEIDEVTGELTYEKLGSLKYMDMVISETLRKWPPAIAMDRICVKPYTIPAEGPNEVDLHLEIGDAIWLPIAGIQRDPKYFPDPENFDPERFNIENKLTIKPYTYNPFGYGPRNCIGARLALLETKAAFFRLLSKCSIEVVAKTPQPLQMDRSQVNLIVKGGLWLGFKARN